MKKITSGDCILAVGALIIMATFIYGTEAIEKRIRKKRKERREKEMSLEE